MKRLRTITIRFFASLSTVALAAALAAAQTAHHADRQQPPTDKPKSSPPAGHKHDGHLDGVNQRGDQAMGFSQAKTTHHFFLKPDGGTIEVTANDPADTASRDQIRMHLRHIAKKFADGDFAAPMFIHSQTPPGVPAMKQLKAEIKYEFEELERGGRVRIRAANADALSAIHEFLRFQIEDHQTGDSKELDGLRH
jgi:hypothetical protein